MVYVCAGMYRSGSTWLYNAMRMLLEAAGVKGLAAGWIEQKAALLQHPNPVVKIHAFDPSLASTKNVVVTSHRDLRDVAASLARKFKEPFSMQTLRETVESHAQWSRVAVYDLRYENLLVDKRKELAAVAGVLRLAPGVVERLPLDSISRQIEGEKFTEERATAQRYDAVNLLHHGHITDGRHGSWEGVLPPETVAAIEREFRPWMVARGYLA